MIVRSALLVGTTLLGMLTTSDAQAQCFGKRKCCQETPVVCPQACCQAANSGTPVVGSNCPAPPQSFSYTDAAGTPKILVERKRTVTRTVNGSSVSEIVTEIGEATPEEARNIINQKLDSISNALVASGSDTNAINEVNTKIGNLQRAVFGDKEPPKDTPLESRVETLEKSN